MKIREVNDLATNLMKQFVDAIGLDGETYVNSMGYPSIFLVDKNILGGIGQYVSPSDKSAIQEILASKPLTKPQILSVKERGFIRINKEYYQEAPFKDKLITIIHERFHANRNLMLFDVVPDRYIADKDKLVQGDDKYVHYYSDPNQEIMKGNFDTAQKTIEEYKNKTKKEIEQIQFQNEENDTNYIYSKNVDETLVELMACLCQLLYSKPDMTIHDQLKKLSEYEITKEDDIDFARLVYMSRIILRHNDYELFKWMIDPIGYSYGDMHYDFFKDYIKNDPEELSRIFSFTDEDDYIEEISSTVTK